MKIILLGLVLLSLLVGCENPLEKDEDRSPTNDYGNKDQISSYLKHENGIASYQTNDTRRGIAYKKGQSLGIDDIKLLKFLQQECSPVEHGDILADEIGYTVFFKALTKCDISRPFKPDLDGTLFLGDSKFRKDNSKKTIIIADYDFEYYIDIPKIRENNISRRESTLTSKELIEKYKNLDKSINVEHIQFATDFLKFVTGIDDPNLINELIEVNLRKKINIEEVSSKDEIGFIYAEKHIDGYVVRVSRVFSVRLHDKWGESKKLSILITKEG